MSAIDTAVLGFGLAAVWFGWRVFVTDSMVRASFALLASFLNAGAIMVALLGEYLGVALLFMMTVEMVVMALFMVAFMMNPAGLNPMQMVHQHRTAIGAGVAMAVGLATVALTVDWPDDPLPEHAVAGTIRALGHEVMGGSMLLMQTVGVTLFATIVGATVLTSAHGRFGRGDDGSEPPPLDPDEPGSGRRGDRPASGGGHHHDHGGHG